MSRVSFKEFSAGLPVTQVNPKAPRIPEAAPQGNLISRIIKDAPGDIVETFKGIVGAGVDAGKNVKEAFTRPGLTIPQRGVGALVAPFSGAVNAGGEVLKGGAKLFTTDEFEQETNKVLVSAGQAAMNSQAGMKLREFYDTLPDDSKFMLSNVFAPIANVMTAGIGGGTTQAGAKAAKTALKSSVKETVKRTPQEAAEAVVMAANPVTDTVKTASNPILDTIKGAATQVADFAKRTATEAQDTAVQARRLSEMPAPKSQLIKNGADERIVNVVEKATPEEVKVYRELIDQAKAKEIDPTPNTPQPKVIAGREFLKPVDYVINKRKEVGKSLGEYRKKLSKTKEIDTNVAFRNFHNYLKENFGVQFDKEGKIRTDAGTIATSDIPQVQKLYDTFKSDKKNSQVELDQWLQRTYKDYDLVQKREQTFSEEVSRIAEYARGEVRELMPEDYNRLATDYAQLSRPLTEFVKLVGYKGNLDELTAKELKTGEVALRILGNAADRPQSVIDGILETATAKGYQSNIDLNRLIYITDQLEDLYDITPSRGFSGSATRGINQSDAAGVIGDAATMNFGGLFNRAMGSRASQKEIQKSFEDYIKYLDEGGEPGSFKSGETPQPTTSAAATIRNPISETDLKAKVGESYEDLKVAAQAKIELAKDAKTFIDDEAQKIVASIPNTKLASAPVKSLERIIEKAAVEEGGDIENIRDIARNTVVPFNVNAQEAAIKQLSERTDLARPPKIQTPDKFMGYEGFIANVKAPNGLVSEIQVVTPQMTYGKNLPEFSEAVLGKDLFEKLKASGLEPGLGHKFYEEIRSLDESAADYLKRLKEIETQSVDYYNKLRNISI